MTTRTPRQELWQVRRRSDTTAVYAALPPQLAAVAGDFWHVRPYTGSDSGNTGRSPDNAFKTLAKALAMAKANQNDIVFLHAENNTAAQTTDYQNALLDWNKDAVHLIGVNSGPLFSHRSRIAFQSAYNTATDLFKLSANGCYLANLEIFMGVTGTLPTGCMTLSGWRNRIVNCHIAGFGGTAGTNDIASAYSLQLYSAAENVIEDCIIGVDTIQCGAQANSQILFTQGALGVRRNIFKRCRVMMYTNHATNHLFLRSLGPSMDRFNEFENCRFINDIGTTLTYAFSCAAPTSPAGIILLTGDTCVKGAGRWNVSDTGHIYATQYSETANVEGIMEAVTA